MAIPEVIEEISLVDEGQFLESVVSDASVRWLPLMSISSTGLWLGLSVEGMWVLGRKTGHVVISGQPLPQTWLVILDFDYQEFLANLEVVAVDRGLSATTIQESVPIDDVLAMAMTSSSDHWVGRAVIWMENRTVHDYQEILLRELSAKRSLNQQTRHRVNRILKSLKKKD
jgi:hypothetical protein